MEERQEHEEEGRRPAKRIWSEGGVALRKLDGARGVAGMCSAAHCWQRRRRGVVGRGGVEEQEQDEAEEEEQPAADREGWGHENKPKALFNRLTNGRNEFGWRLERREEGGERTYI